MDQQGPDTYDTGHCMGVVQAVTDMLTLYQDKLPIKFCMPGNITYGQSVRIVTKYMLDHPVDLNAHDSIIVLLALKDAYPCN